MDKLAAFKEIAGRQNQDRERSGWRYTKESRQLALSHCHEQRRAGRPFSAIAEELGITTPTLGRWLEEPVEPGFHEVKLAPASPAPGGGLRVVLPSGLCIEGLDLGQVVELARLLP